ncbi:Gfo/Idh/MocA family protein [Pseudomonas agarici]|uniref:Gfo/Idh/MocA family protein n=1 Tax=Pseudomonas agarici TaxID=46677 RepID=UPI0005844D8B|nr:Gfo/Idh/MocA family oxidoreductase [Pseudomonas agarici]NWB92153.1 Gfo/Idh/MocA family oxidoreductase [Pseudomonas agarici]NWC09802.1 Gfo/Idh/MocA family oxidoreductase [Pseudomonas agarici]SEL30428.1 4,5-dihydroxyphthalate dehydrogenase [Pseudomonas agarici]
MPSHAESPPRLRLGVVGLGRAFTLMLPTFLADRRVQLVGACDPRASAREQFERDFAAPAFETIEALAADSNVDALYIASPHQFHAEHTRIAATHRKHVLVEKPMALSLNECDRMIADCAQAGVNMIVGHCHSFDTPYLRTRELIGSGEFGAVKMIQALNYTDYLQRPRRPEELSTAEGGGAVFSQAAHQVDVVRLLAGSRAIRVRAAVGNWDPARPTEGAYTATLWFENGAFASITYNGYGYFDSDEWMGWVGEMGKPKTPEAYGKARRLLQQVQSAEEEARLKAESTYGGKHYIAASPDNATAFQHFGPIIVSCEGGDLKPMADAVMIYRPDSRDRLRLEPPTVPRSEVIDELYLARFCGVAPLHDGQWARDTLEICLAMLQSSDEQRDITLGVNVATTQSCETPS